MREGKERRTEEGRELGKRRVRERWARGEEAGPRGQGVGHTVRSPTTVLLTRLIKLAEKVIRSLFVRVGERGPP